MGMRHLTLRQVGPYEAGVLERTLTSLVVDTWRWTPEAPTGALPCTPLLGC